MSEASWNRHIPVLNRAGFAEGHWFKLRRHGGLFEHGGVALFGLRRRDVVDGLQEPPVVEPVHPFQGQELDGFEAAPWSAAMDHLGLVETVDGFGESISTAVALHQRCVPIRHQPRTIGGNYRVNKKYGSRVWTALKRRLDRISAKDAIWWSAEASIDVQGSELGRGMMAPITWNLPIADAHHLSASAGALSFVGGAGDFDAAGRIRHPGDLDRQIEGAMMNVTEALATESCTLQDVVRLKAHYTAERDDWEVIAAMARFFKADPMPAISTVPEPLQPFSGQTIQIQAIAQRGWRTHADIRAVPRPVPPQRHALFAGRPVTAGLRAGEFITVANRTAEDADGVVRHPDDGVAQTHFIMERHAETLAALGASFQDSVKLEGYHFGSITREQWVPFAKARASYFREPGPAGTVVPCHRLNPKGALTKVEVIAMRQLRNGFDKYIPREDHWPERVWDWSIPVPYRQAIRLRDTVWLGGQVPQSPYSNKAVRVMDGQLMPQTRFTMSYVQDLLRPFGRTPADLKLMVCYFASTGTEAETIAFTRTLADCVGGALPPMTLVPEPTLHSSGGTVEIWGVAQG